MVSLTWRWSTWPARRSPAYCDGHRLSIRERLQLFRQVMDAVQYAHAHLVVHRDLKPSNVLVTAAGQVQLLDFGIASSLPRVRRRRQRLTGSVGAASDSRLCRTGADRRRIDYNGHGCVWVGRMLHELLTGERPYRLRQGSRGALEEAILNVEATAPSRVAVSADAAVRAPRPLNS